MGGQSGNNQGPVTPRQNLAWFAFTVMAVIAVILAAIGFAVYAILN